MVAFRFDRFLLDPDDRRLSREGAAVELNARYLDALALLVGEAGRLVTKDRFMGEVWRGVPVTDEALTQCVKTLRRQLGDDAVRPRFIETVPKHGYRFVAAVEVIGKGAEESSLPLDGGGESTAGSQQAWREHLLLGGAGVLGAGVAGMIGGLVYGLAAASQPNGTGAISVLLVLLSLTLFAALIGGAGVCLGIAVAGLASGRLGPWSVAGGALGGLAVGALGKLLGLDAFHLLLGQSPGDITGAAEGALLGGAVGLAAWLGAGRRSFRRGVALAAAIGASAGLVIALLGGRLMAGSLDLLAGAFPGSRLRLDPVGALFGEAGLGPVSQTVTGALEGALFVGCIVGALILARRSMKGDA